MAKGTIMVSYTENKIQPSKNEQSIEAELHKDRNSRLNI